MKYAALVLALCSFGRPGAHAGGHLVGTVKLPPGTASPVLAQRYQIVNHEGVVRVDPPTAVVYLEGKFPPPAHPAVAEIIQKDLAFEPSLLPIRVGTRVEFPNHDDTFHNVFSFSPAKRFDLGRYQPNETPVPAQIFETPGLVTLRCEIHQHMRGLILVLDTPYFVRTETDGRFRLTDLPVGTHTLKAWIDSKTTRSLEVEIREGETTEVNFP